MRDEKAKKCINPWYKFLAILCISILTLFAVFEVRPKEKVSNFKEVTPKNEDKNVGKVLIASSGNDLKHAVAVQFETCRSFIVVNPLTEEYIRFPNNPNSYNINRMKNFIERNKVESVITGTMNIDTYQMLNSLNVEIYTGVTGSAKNALKMYKNHEFVSSNGPNYMKENNEFLKDTVNRSSETRIVF